MVHLPNDWVYCFDKKLKDELMEHGWQPLFAIHMDGRKVWVFDRTPEIMSYIQKRNYGGEGAVCKQHVFFRIGGDLFGFKSSYKLSCGF